CWESSLHTARADARAWLGWPALSRRSRFSESRRRSLCFDGSFPSPISSRDASTYSGWTASSSERRARLLLLGPTICCSPRWRSQAEKRSQAPRASGGARRPGTAPVASRDSGIGDGMSRTYVFGDVTAEVVVNGRGPEYEVVHDGRTEVIQTLALPDGR